MIWVGGGVIVASPCKISVGRQLFDIAFGRSQKDTLVGGVLFDDRMSRR